MAAKKKTPPKKAPAKKKTSPKKASAKKAPTKKAPTKKASTKKASAKKASTKKARATKVAKPGPAREARQAHAMKKAIEQVISPSTQEGSGVVDAYMSDIDHPFKAEMQAVREIILGASPKLAERIKWNAPSFYYKEDFAAFHPRASEYAHLVLLFPGGVGVPGKSALGLEGKAKDRREAKFHSLTDVANKRRALEKLVKDWVKLRDA